MTRCWSEIHIPSDDWIFSSLCNQPTLRFRVNYRFSTSRAFFFGFKLITVSMHQFDKGKMLSN